MPPAPSIATLESVRDVEQLDDLLSTPTPGVVETFGRLDGDLLILGVAGKMGPTLAWMARRAFDAAGRRDRRVIGVARFSDPASEAWLRDRGIETIRGDLLEPGMLDSLPDIPNVVSMFAMKFGSTGKGSLTWGMNALIPGLMAQRFRRSKIVAFSTGNVYGLTPVSGGGSKETDELQPVGEYAMSCLGRERIYEHQSRTLNIPMALIRLNYAVEMRYGILVDLARRVLAGETIDLGMGCFNIIWQADANAITLRAFDHVASPPLVLNVTGPEIVRVRDVAEKFGKAFGKQVVFRGTEGVDALLNDASLSRRMFGPPQVDVDRLIDLTIDWVCRDGATLGKPTHFEDRDGRF